MFSDSHGRDLVKLLAGVEVNVKGGAKMERVVEGISKRSHGGCTVIMGGTNDESVEEVKRGLFKLREGLGANGRVVIVGVPHRYDKTYRNSNQVMPKDKLVARDNLIREKNVLLKQFCDFHGYKFLNIDDSQRYFYTNHGLHFNMTGKRWLADKIQTAVNFL